MSEYTVVFIWFRGFLKEKYVCVQFHSVGQIRLTQLESAGSEIDSTGVAASGFLHRRDLKCTTDQ